MSRISSDLVKRIISSLGNKEALPWPNILSRATPNALDLITKMMNMEPWLRISAADALQHPYLAEFHDPEVEPVCSKHVVLETDTLESMNPDQLKEALADHASKYNTGRSDRPSCNKSEPGINRSEKPRKSSFFVESPDFLAGLDDDVPSIDDDVIMLSAKFEEAALEDRKPFVGASQEDAKSRLRNALQAKAAAKAAEPFAAAAATAQSRHLERQEKRRKRFGEASTSQACRRKVFI